MDISEILQSHEKEQEPSLRNLTNGFGKPEEKQNKVNYNLILSNNMKC